MQCEAFAFHDPRRVRFGQVHATSVNPQSRAFQEAQHLRKGLRTVVAGMVVGHTHRVEMALHVGQAAGRDAEHIGFFVFRAADGGDHAFQVADADIGLAEKLGKPREGVAAPAHGLAGAIFEHDVAHDDQRDGVFALGFGVQGGASQSQGADREPMLEACFHGDTSANAQRYCSSLPRSGEYSETRPVKASGDGLRSATGCRYCRCCMTMGWRRVL